MLKKARVIQSIVNNLPFPLHIPGYNYCGPGTKLNQDQTKDPKPINRVDAICQTHDYSYRMAKNKNDIRRADCLMIYELDKLKNLHLNEKIGKLISKTGIKAKIALGSGRKKRKWIQLK